MAKITGDTLIFDCLKQNPKASEILQEYGMHCFGCALARGETVAQAAAAHGNNVEELVEKLNQDVQ